MVDASKSWERQPGEGAIPHAAFVAYRDMDPAARSLVETARSLGKSARLIRRWSHDHHWPQRVQDYDALLAEVAVEAVAQATIEDAVARNARHTAAGRAGLEWVVESIFAGRANGEKLPAATLASVMKTCVAIEREAAGEAGSTVGVRVDMRSEPFAVVLMRPGFEAARAAHFECLDLMGEAVEAKWLAEHPDAAEGDVEAFGAVGSGTEMAPSE